MEGAVPESQSVDTRGQRSAASQRNVRYERQRANNNGERPCALELVNTSKLRQASAFPLSITFPTTSKKTLLQMYYIF
ncbi:Protein of unknown function [Gryllus bimaculatus]|nr:Protein of unknown function [Gryllus bimaculatus]